LMGYEVRESHATVMISLSMVGPVGLEIGLQGPGRAGDCDIRGSLSARRQIGGRILIRYGVRSSGSRPDRHDTRQRPDRADLPIIQDRAPEVSTVGSSAVAVKKTHRSTCSVLTSRAVPDACEGRPDRLQGTGGSRPMPGSGAMAGYPGLSAIGLNLSKYLPLRCARDGNRYG
jgi:hypothetical protein